MDPLTEQLLQQLGPDGLTKVSRQIGAPKRATRSALSTIAPLLLSALANNASQPQGAESLQQALVEDHNGAIFDNLGGFLSNPQSANGAGILGHILGDQQPVVTQGLAQNTGLDTNQIGSLMQIAAPLLMGALGQQTQQQHLDPSGLASFLGGQQQAIQQSSPNLMGVLNTLLDTNRNGSALDEIMGMVGNMLAGNKPR